MNDRGMKKWLPFSSLVEQGKYLEKMIYEKYKIERPQVFNEQARKIDQTLREYDFKTPLRMDIFYDGYIYKVKEIIRKIDTKKKVIYFDDFYIPIKNIIDIEEINIFDRIC